MFQMANIHRHFETERLKTCYLQDAQKQPSSIQPVTFCYIIWGFNHIKKAVISIINLSITYKFAITF